ncbi:MAG: hypothetical protein J2P25_03075 [Nocardiopsaceae bacterium]|nr:hypothetical protein [Nocardiopsaceae bacterium]
MRLLSHRRIPRRRTPLRQRLDVIDGALRAEAPALAAKYDMFTRLARGEGDPPSEQSLRPTRTRLHRLSAWWWRWSRRLHAPNSPVRA